MAGNFLTSWVTISFLRRALLLGVSLFLTLLKCWNLNTISTKTYIILKFCTVHCQSRDSSVGIALGYGLDDRGSRVRFPAGAGNFSLHRIQNGSGAHSASYPVGTWGSFPGGKATGREADHSRPSSAEVKECVELYLHSPIRLHGVVLKVQGQLYLYFLLYTATHR
jgi:hypothetical protein